MSNGTEQIEARLAAYIDGELPDSERAEIEKYLAANPAHRQMIEELKGQHELVASLPREKAPVEILDHLQGHLERQSLLENVEDAAGSLRINRWPQLGAIAAMLLLTVGLGALVYSVLPGGMLNRDQVAIARPELQGLPATPSLGDDKDAAALKESKDETRTRPAGDLERAITRDGFAPRRADQGDFVDNVAREFEAARADHLRKMNEKEKVLLDKIVTPTSPLALNNGSAIVVSTDDPMITQNLLAGYLGQNEFDFHSVRPELARAATSLSELMTLPVDEAVKKSAAPITQQAIGAVVSRVNQRENAQPNGEQYLVVRNLSKDQAEKLNVVINKQRGARQQARLYGNSDLYPEYNLATQTPLNAGYQRAEQQQQQQLQQQEGNASQQKQQQDYPGKFPQAAPGLPEAVKAETPKTELGSANVAGGGAESSNGLNTKTGADGWNRVPSSGPATDAIVANAAVASVSDVLIVLRSEPVADVKPVAPAAPEAVPAVTTLPGVEPSPVEPVVSPDASEKPSATQPTTAPSTQPATTRPTE